MAGKQRRQIARVLRMQTAIGVKMSHRICKSVALHWLAVAGRVDVKAKKAPAAGGILLRQPPKLSTHENAPRHLPKLDKAGKIGIGRAAMELRRGVRPLQRNWKRIQKITSHGYAMPREVILFAYSSARTSR